LRYGEAYTSSTLRVKSVLWEWHLVVFLKIVDNCEQWSSQAMEAEIS